MAGNIAHDNIINIHDFGEDQGRPYIVMEFLRGESLKEAIKNNRPPDLDGKLLIALQIARAVEYIHSKRIIHRDIKPDNIHIDANGKVKLMDFGISKSEGLELTRAGFTLGSPYYMAPEQVLGRQVTNLVDVYAFGVLLFELLSGVKPIAGESVERLFYSILNEPLNLEPLEKAAVPEPVRDLVARCTAKTPADRIQSFTLVAEQLEKQLNQPAARQSRADPAPAAADRQWRSWVLVAGGTFVVVISIVVAVSEQFGIFRWILPGAVAVAGAVVLARRKIGRVWQDKPLPLAHAAAAAPAPAKRAPEESTSMFQTSPPPAARPPKLRPPTTPAPTAQPAGGVEEFTQMFRVGGGAAKNNQAVRDAGPFVPDVALTITSSTDLAAMGRRIRLDHFPFRIARTGGDLELPFDTAISHEHAEVDFSQGGFTIRDLGSTNGTFVNGRRLRSNQPEPLLYGTKLLLGSNTLLTFVSNELEELPDLTGKVIRGRYTLSERMFASAKSVVYKASDSELPQSVVVKILSPRLARHPGYREQFEHEAKMAFRLRHPSVNRVLGYGETELGVEDAGQSLYVCLEYLDGGNLSQRLATNESFALERVAGWLDKLAAGLDYVHGQSMVHGGIKPSAILFDSSDNPYLTDFAIATSAEDKSQRTLIGSPPYLAPEQWEGGELLTATDQYSLAVLFYLIVTGVLPHEGQEHPEVRKRNFQRGPLPAHEMAAQNQRPAVPATLSPVLKRAMAMSPSDRFPTALEFARAFSGALTPAAAPGARRPSAFISYNRSASSAWALLFKNELERGYGCDAFVDAEQRDKAGRFPQKLERRIQQADVFVCLLAENTLDSAWVNREIEVAHAAQKPMIPVFQESFHFPEDMATLPHHVQELLMFDGVKLLDRQNVFIDAAIKLLNDVIRQSAPA